MPINKGKSTKRLITETENLFNMTDVLGHRLEVGDYVTAMFMSGEVAPFLVNGFRKGGKSHRGWAHQEIETELIRLVKTGDGELDSKPVFKKSAAITFVTEEQIVIWKLLS
jgi:hypothetical protein